MAEVAVQMTGTSVACRAAALRQLARWRANGIAIPPAMFERLHDDGLGEFMKTLNTRQADTLARAPSEDIVVFLLTGRPIPGVPDRGGSGGQTVIAGRRGIMLMAM